MDFNWDMAGVGEIKENLIPASRHILWNIPAWAAATAAAAAAAELA